MQADPAYAKIEVQDDHFPLNSGRMVVRLRRSHEGPARGNPQEDDLKEIQRDM